MATDIFTYVGASSLRSCHRVYLTAHDAECAGDFISSPTIGQSWNENNPWYCCHRHLMYWDTTSIPTNAKITSAKVKFHPNIISEHTATYSIVLQDGMPTYMHIPREYCDYYKNHWSGNYGQIHSSSIVLDAWNEIELSSGGLSALQSAISDGRKVKLIMRCSNDIGGIEPPQRWPEAWASNSIRVRHSGATGHGVKLEITYYLTYFGITQFDQESPREWGQNCDIDIKVKNNDAGSGHLGWVVCAWRKKGSSDAWNKILDTTDAYDAEEEKTFEANFTMPNYDVEVSLTAYHVEDTTWYVDDNELDYVTLAVPSVTTIDALGILQTSAFLRGKVNFKASKYGFEWDEDSGAPYANSWDTTEYIDGVMFAHLISGLDAGKTYYFRAKAYNSAGWGYGDELEFTTNAEGVPLVTTLNATGIDTESAFLRGTVTDDMEVVVDNYGFEWGLTDTYTHSWTAGEGTIEGATFIHLIESLDADTTYHFRAKAHNVNGWGYGDDLTFVTLGAAPGGGYIWVEGAAIHYTGSGEREWILELTEEGATGQEAGHVWIEGTDLHYIDESGNERHETGTDTGSNGTAGHLWVESTALHYIDDNGDERYL